MEGSDSSAEPILPIVTTGERGGTADYYDQYNLEKEMNKELIKKIENIKLEKEEENEKYRNLVQAFEELYSSHMDLLKKQECLLTNQINLSPEQKNELLGERDKSCDLVKQIRHRSGLDAVHKSRTRRTSSLEGYLTGSALLRTSGGSGQRLSGRFSRLSIDEGSNGVGSVHLLLTLIHELLQKPLHRLSSSPLQEIEESPTQPTSRAPSSEPPKRRLSLLQGLQKTIPILHLTPDEPLEHSNHEESQQSSPLPPNVLGGVQRGSVVSPGSAMIPFIQTPTVPLFEHFLVIGVSVEAAFSVSEQLIQKQTRLTQRLMNKLSGFFRPSAGNSRNRSASQLSNVVDENDTLFRSSMTTAAPPSRGIFSRMLSREEVSDDSRRTSVERRPSDSSSWTSSLFSRISTSTSAPTLETPKDVGSSTESDQSSPSKASSNASNAILGQGSKTENATFTEPEILYRYPDDADPPPTEVCDFCMPSGGKLRHLQPNDSETSILEIMYGHGQNQRNSRCFIFILEDKTLDTKQNPEDCESGINTGRTYGICVVHPRLLNPKYPSGYSKEEFLAQQEQNVEDPSSIPPIEFEASVCYCFITRFPLYEFFFHVIFNMITYERMMRLEKLDPTTSMTDKHVYEYIPINIYRDILDKLSLLSPPRFNTSIEFKFSPTVAPINYLRLYPTSGTPEHILRAAEWALPPLIRWLNPKILVWALGLLMCEVKFIVIGIDPATVSCAVIGLTSLLKPLQWVSPMIPIMPLKHIEFLESPVPLIAGMVLDGDHAIPESLSGESITPLSLLKLCDDGESVTAVLDLSARDIYVLNSHSEVVPELVFPHAEDLIQDIQTALYNYTTDPLDPHYDSSYHHITGTVRRENRPTYNISVDDMAACKAIQELVYNHLTMVGQAAKEVAGEVLKEQMEAVEQRVKANLEKIEKFKLHSTHPQQQQHTTGTSYRSSLAPLNEDNHEDHQELDHETSSSTTTGTAPTTTTPTTHITNTLPFQDINDSTSLESNPIASLSSSNQSENSKSLVPQISRSVSLPIPQANSIIVGAGNMIPIVSLQSLFIDTTETKKLFLRRFVTTQMFTEYDQEIIDILQDMNFVNEHFDDARIPGNIQSSAATVSRKGSTTSIGHPAAGNKGVVIGSGRAHGGRSRSLYFSSNDLVK